MAQYSSPWHNTQAHGTVLKPTAQYSSPWHSTQAHGKILKPMAQYSSPCHNTQPLATVLNYKPQYLIPPQTTQQHAKTTQRKHKKAQESTTKATKKQHESKETHDGDKHEIRKPRPPSAAIGLKRGNNLCAGLVVGFAGQPGVGLALFVLPEGAYTENIDGIAALLSPMTLVDLAYAAMGVLVMWLAARVAVRA